jgi:cellulose synthase/poly-beta-1,6-N-acetylglucosamine synthase-like glycosyltransferase
VNPVWEPIFRIGQRLNLKTPDTDRNFVTNKDIVNLLEIGGYEVIKEKLGMFLPANIPLIAPLLNFIMPEIPALRQLCAVQYIVAKPKRPGRGFSCSVVIPCHNEKDNIADCLKRIPRMGSFTEAIVVDDGSTDGTASAVREELNRDIEIKLISYKPNQGKGHAVRVGFDSARGDVLMILDADMAVMPEELPRFFRLFEEGHADFVNGTRMVYPMEKRAMPLVNYVGNKVFNLALSWIMEQRVSDTLCGTKAMFRKDYRKIHMEDRSWGDFDFLFGAAKLCLKFHELPVHYKMRIAGESKMKVLKHGWMLCRVSWRGMKQLKFSKVC